MSPALEAGFLVLDCQGSPMTSRYDLIWGAEF